MRTIVWLMAAGMCGQAAAPGNGPAVVAGIDAGSGIAYTLISVDGKLLQAAAPAVPPRLTAQCTRGADGKLRFELLADFGGVETIAYYPPWKPTKEISVRPPVQKTIVTMDFLGYMKVKPVKRQWEYLHELPQEMMYATPGFRSANMEEVMFYLQYMRALPTLRLTVPGKGTVEFETTKWQAAVKAEPMCHASGL